MAPRQFRVYFPNLSSWNPYKYPYHKDVKAVNENDAMRKAWEELPYNYIADTHCSIGQPFKAEELK